MNMEKSASCKGDEHVPKTVECKMSSKMCLLKSDVEKSSCKVEDLVSKVIAGANDVCDGVVKEEYEICDANGFSSTVLCGEEIDNLMPLEYVKVELTEENSETDANVQKAAARQEEFCHKNTKSCIVETRSSALGYVVKAKNNANEDSSESVDSAGSEVKVETTSSADKQKVTENKENTGSR